MSNASSKSDDLPQPKSWNPWWAVVAVGALFYGSQIFASIVVSVYPLLQGWSEKRADEWLTSSVPAQFVFFLCVELLAIGAVYLFLRAHKQSWRAIGLLRPRLRDLAFGLLAVIPYFLIYLVTLTLATVIFPSLDINQEQQIGFKDVQGPLALSLTFISLVILVPLAEEIVVRGLLYTSLKRILPLLFAALTTSALFAIAHLPEGGPAGPLYIAAIDTFVLSLVLIYLREKTGSLWASITLHAAKNGIAFASLFIFVTH